MKVLWLSITPSLFDETKQGGWIASLERIFREYGRDIKLGIAFEYSRPSEKKVDVNITYYPIYKFKKKTAKLRLMFDYKQDWELLRPYLLDVIDDFNPDIIHCFGSEWSFGLISEYTNIPVVLHMQGFANIYRLSASMCCRKLDIYRFHNFNPFSVFHYWYRSLKGSLSDDREKKVMKINKYFMGRTEWDKNIVKYFSLNSKYYHCEEAIRPEFFLSEKRWTYKKRKQMKIITISSASDIKGNDLILRTALILKSFGFEFEWRVAGNIKTFSLFESILRLKHNNLNIKTLGFISANQVVDELCNADVYVHTAIIDNSPNSLCEAQIIGCPVISTNVGGIPQLVNDKKTGILFPFNEPHTLAFKLMNVFNDRTLMEDLSKNEMEVAFKRHSPQSIYTNLIAIYKNILLEENK